MKGRNQRHPMRILGRARINAPIDEGIRQVNHLKEVEAALAETKRRFFFEEKIEK